MIVVAGSAGAIATFFQSARRAELVLDRGRVEPARRRAGRSCGTRGRRPPRPRARPTPPSAATAASTPSSPTLRAHAATPSSSSAVDVRAFRPLLRALGDDAPEPRREARDRARVARRAVRPHAHEQRVAVAVVAQLLDRERVAGGLALVPELAARERLQNHASPVSRVSRSASSSIHASISTRPVAASWTIAARSVRLHRGAARPGRAARRAAREPRRVLVEDRREQRRLRDLERLGDVARLAGAARRDHRHRDGVGDLARSARGRSRRACRPRRST